MHTLKTLSLVTGTLVLAGCSLFIDAQLDEKGMSSGTGGSGGQGGGAVTSASTSAGVTTSTSAAESASASQSSSASSGGCGSGCVFANAKGECNNGTCALGPCNKDFADCDLAPENGCETDLKNNDDHCGSCAKSCMPGQGCSGGKCK